ncbi:MAG: hypothetical protein WAW75_07860 [Gallionella sp.]
MRAKIIDEQLKVYQSAFIQHGDSPKGTHQNNRETQYLRFQMLTDHLLNNHTDNTIEDVGCGICDLYGYLKSKNIKFTYSGTEIVDEMIALAKEKYPEITVKNRDILSEVGQKKNDFVVLSGTLNIPGNVEPEEWRRFCFSLISSMYGMCNKAIAFNFLTSHKTFTDPNLFYFDPSELLDYCIKNLSRFVELKHSYPLYEGTITVYRENYIQDQYKNPALAKYFRAPHRKSVNSSSLGDGNAVASGQV